MSESYGIAEIAREFGVTTRTIRFYEDKGLINPVRQGQRRIYSARDRVRLKLIMRGKRLGFSLEEIAEILDLYDVDPTQVAQLRLFLAKVRERRDVLRQQQQDIDASLRELDHLEVQCTELLAAKQHRAGAGGAE